MPFTFNDVFVIYIWKKKLFDVLVLFSTHIYYKSHVIK